MRLDGVVVVAAAALLCSCSLVVSLDGRFCDENGTCDDGGARPVDGGDVAAARACAVAPCPGSACPRGIKVEYASTDLDDTTSRIRLQLRIVNDGPADEELSQLEIRYHYTADSGDDQIFECTFASASALPGGCDNVTGVVRRRTPMFDGADQELAVGFAPGSGTLRAGGGDTAALKMNVRPAGNAAYDQRDDYSFDGTTEVPHVWPCVTLHRKPTGELLFGLPPR